ncbi:hypothetical protein TNCV_1075591 [Trichonephila clavipes]|uniref:DUF4817 domain-containing protein n=1 Tax=Trichonephila clavipes TaxID=2585209 RepID=A0A8X6VLP1_TRICX|nr:hypothetical protein TNCV_1075591 [Trichonephila clavipes]
MSCNAVAAVNDDKFLHCCDNKLPLAKSIKRWFEVFKETGSVINVPRSGRISVSETTVEALSAIVSTES